MTGSRIAVGRDRRARRSGVDLEAEADGPAVPSLPRWDNYSQRSPKALR